MPFNPDALPGLPDYHSDLFQQMRPHMLVVRAQDSLCAACDESVVGKETNVCAGCGVRWIIFGVSYTTSTESLEEMGRRLGGKGQIGHGLTFVGVVAGALCEYSLYRTQVIPPQL